MLAERNYELGKRRYVLGAIAFAVVFIYVLRLFSLQLLSDDFKRNADSNAFLRRIQYPARNGKLMVYNQPAYDIMVVMKEQEGIDTMGLCNALGITVEWYEKRMEEIKDRNRNPATAAIPSSCS